MASIGTLVVNLGANIGGLIRGLGRATAAVSSFTKNAVKQVSGMAVAMGSAIGGAGMAIGAAGIAAGGYAVKLASDAQKTQVALEVLLGSVESAEMVIQSMRDVAVESPFDAQQLIEATKVFVQFGQGANQAMTMVEALSKVAVGDAEKLDRLTLAMAQSAAAGRLMGQDLLQMINAGFNPLFYMSQRTGVSMQQLRKEMEKGNITYQMVQHELELLTTGTGRFANINARLTKTFSGQWQKFTEQLTNVGRTIGEAILPPATKFLKWINDLIPAIQATAKVMIAVFSAIGLSIKAMWETARDYTKASLTWMANAAIQTGKNIAAAIKSAFIGKSPMSNWKALPAFQAPDLGPAGRELAKTLESIFTEAAGKTKETVKQIGEDNPISNIRLGGGQQRRLTELPAAMLRGSAEAYSAIVRSRGGGDPVKDAIDAQTQALLDPLNAIAAQGKNKMPVELIGAIV